MHWGHVSSADLVTWQREPLALALSLDEDSGGIYSGSAVTEPDGQLYAYYTGNRWKNPANRDEGNMQVHLYTSNDMMGWYFSGVLYEDPREDVFMLECPDLFELDGKWVLMFCPERPRPVGYSNRNTHIAGYLVGNWQPGDTFVPLTEYRQVDWGHNFYTPQTLMTPDGQRVCWGWMGSFTPTCGKPG